MAKIALIQDLFPSLRRPDSRNQFAVDSKKRFFEILVEESGHEVYQAENLSDYQAKGYPTPDFLICTPFPESGNLAGGIEKLMALRDAFPDVPLVVWSERTEEAIKKTALEEFGAVAFYQGTIISAGDDFADMVLKYTS